MGNAVKHLIGIAVCVCLGVGQIAAQTSLGAWATTGVQVPVQGPAPDIHRQVAFDGARGVTVLYGPSPGETHEFDGVGWRSVATAVAPTATYGASMTYVDSLGKVLYFGGHDGVSVSDETWLYDGVNWTLIQSAFSPVARRDCLLVYDVLRDKVVLFGGSDLAGNDFTDTWEWSVQAGWYPKFSIANPGAWEWMGGGYAGERFGVVAHGGAKFSPNYRLNTATWSFDGSQWRRLAGFDYGQAHHNLVWDPNGQMLHFVSGATSIGNPSAHWIMAEYDLRQAVVSGGPPSYAASVWDSWRDVLVSVDTYTMITWLMTPVLVAGQAVTFGQGCGPNPPVLRSVGGAGPVIGKRAELSLTRPVSGLGIIGIGLSNTRYGSLVLPTPLIGAGMAGCTLFVALDSYEIPRPGAGGDLVQGVDLPLLPELVGQHLFFQGFTTAPGANSIGLVVSNAVDWLVGNR